MVFNMTPGHIRECIVVINITGFILTTRNSEDDASLSSFCPVLEGFCMLNV